MSRALGRAAATSVLGALAAAVWLALWYGLMPALRLDFNVDPPRLVSGFYPAERDPDGLSFAWTSDQVTLRLPGLDRHLQWTLDVRVRGARVDPRQNPVLTFAADGTPLLVRTSSVDFDVIRVPIPARPDRRGLTIVMQVSNTFVPGPADPRALGAMVDWLRLSPDGVVVPPRGAFAGTAIAAAALGGAIALLGVTAGSAIGGAIAVAAGTAAVVARGFGPYTNYADTAGRVAIWIGLGLVIVTAVVQRAIGKPLRNTARFAAAFSACALLFKLLVLLHPDMPIGDALFHAHRFQDVLGGKLYFTSTAPGNYLFPYPPGLYVFAAAFARLVPRGPADATLLRVIVASVDAVVALVLYGAVVRARGDRLAAACAVAIYHLVPLAFGVIAAGNLTNAFAQSLSVGALGMMCTGRLRLERWWIVGTFIGILACAFLSHTSTFAILFAAAAFTTLMFLWRGGPALRSPAWAIAIALSAAVLLSVVVYYGHFIDTYRTEFSRLGGEAASGAADAGGRGIVARLGAVPRYVRIYIGFPALALAIWGAWALWKQAVADRLALSLTAWSAACIAFLVLGVLTPIDMRYYLAAIPAIALAGGLGASDGWRAGGGARLAAGALLASTAWVGVTAWWDTLGGS